MTVPSAPSTHATSVTRRWTLDLTRSTAEFEVENFWGLSTVAGRFNRFGGTYVEHRDGRTMELIVDAASLDTRNRRRDRHLRSAEFFHVEEHPQVIFSSRAIAETGDGRLRVSGELEVAGKSMPISFDAAAREIAGELEIEATATVDQRLFGMTWSPLGMVRPGAALHVKARLAQS
jgi:polyisoprenoid-binding protein YceI